jgi:hypothetical protein
MLHDSYVLDRNSLNLFLDIIDDSPELCSIQGSSTDQTSINFWHCHQAVHAVGSDTTSILDTCGLCYFIVVQISQYRAQESVGLVYVKPIINTKSQTIRNTNDEQCILHSECHNSQIRQKTYSHLPHRKPVPYQSPTPVHMQ